MGTVSSIALVCPVSRSQPVAGHVALRLPAIPIATDLPSAIVAVQAMIPIVQEVLRQLPPGNGNPAGAGPASGGAGGGTARRGVIANRPVRSTWIVKDQKTRRIKIFHKNPDGTVDRDQWILVEQTVYVKWYDTVSKQTLIWQGDPQNGSSSERV